MRETKTIQPKRLARLSAGVEPLVGVVFDLQTVFQEIPVIDVGIVFITPILAGLASKFSGQLFPFEGLVFGTVAKFYGQGVIF